LIRALEPLDGLPLMQRRRARAGAPAHRRTSATICEGPGNLTVAMGITLADNLADLTGDRLWIEDRGLSVGAIHWTPRVGIRVGLDRLWRAREIRALA
jgi:DNA-3-methyladenine glycosylase